MWVGTVTSLSLRVLFSGTYVARLTYVAAVPVVVTYVYICNLENIAPHPKTRFDCAHEGLQVSECNVAARVVDEVPGGSDTNRKRKAFKWKITKAVVSQ